MVQISVAVVEISQLMLMLYYKYIWPIIYLVALATRQFQFSSIIYRMCSVRLYNMRDERPSHTVFQSWRCTCNHTHAVTVFRSNFPSLRVHLFYKSEAYAIVSFFQTIFILHVHANGNAKQKYYTEGYQNYRRP